MWDDTKLGLKHLAGWEKMALVSDVEWVRAAVKVFGLAIPGRFACFITGSLRRRLVGSQNEIVPLPDGGRLTTGRTGPAARRLTLTLLLFHPQSSF